MLVVVELLVGLILTPKSTRVRRASRLTRLCRFNTRSSYSRSSRRTRVERQGSPHSAMQREPVRNKDEKRGIAEKRPREEWVIRGLSGSILLEGISLSTIEVEQEVGDKNPEDGIECLNDSFGIYFPVDVLDPRWVAFGFLYGRNEVSFPRQPKELREKKKISNGYCGDKGRVVCGFGPLFGTMEMDTSCQV